MTIKLQPGDYVDLKGNEDKYEQVLKAFVDAGANDLDGGSPLLNYGYRYLVWDDEGDVWTRLSVGYFFKRELTVDQILGTEATLPAIGTKWIECEGGDVVEVVAHHRDAIVCWSEDGGYRSYDVSELLPLDERRKAVVEMAEDINRCHPAIDLATHLYGEGYRKQ